MRECEIEMKLSEILELAGDDPLPFDLMIRLDQRPVTEEEAQMVLRDLKKGLDAAMKQELRGAAVTISVADGEVEVSRRHRRHRR